MPASFFSRLVPPIAVMSHFFFRLLSFFFFRLAVYLFSSFSFFFFPSFFPCFCCLFSLLFLPLVLLLSPLSSFFRSLCFFFSSCCLFSLLFFVSRFASFYLAFIVLSFLVHTPFFSMSNHTYICSASCFFLPATFFQVYFTSH